MHLKNSKPGMGFIDEIAKGFVSGAGGSGGGTGAAGAGGAGGSVSATISPTFQQSFTPQVSPNIQVSTGSGGQTAGTSQQVRGGQQAEGGSSIPADTLPGIPSLSPSNRLTDSPQFLDEFSSPWDNQPIFDKQEKGINWTPIIIVGVAVSLIGAIYFMNQPDTKKTGKK